jgi:hypothetical protein
MPLKAAHEDRNGGPQGTLCGPFAVPSATNSRERPRIPGASAPTFSGIFEGFRGYARTLNVSGRQGLEGADTGPKASRGRFRGRRLRVTARAANKSRSRGAGRRASLAASRGYPSRSSCSARSTPAVVYAQVSPVIRT